MTRNYLSINEEDLIIKTLRILYFRYTYKQKTKTIDGKKELKEIKFVSQITNDLFIKNLLVRKADKKILLYKLIDGLDGEHFQTYIYFIWNIWKNSSYANIDPKTNKLIAITDKSPILIAYQSNKILGFHTDNASINWDGSEALIDISVNIKTGVFEEKTVAREDESQKILVEKQEKHQYSYHPFSPLVLQNAKNPAFLLKDKDQKEGVRFTKLPAFLLYANNQKAFWENVLTGVEYGVDILTTVSGVGNLLKVGRLVKLLKNGKTLLYKTKQVTTAITAVKAVAGVIEVSSGTVNTLLKLTSIDDTELGKNISKYLFYLEMVALTGEVSVFLKGKLQKTAKQIIENPKFTKSLDDLVKKGKISELEEFNFYREILKVSRKYSDDLKKVGIIPDLTNAAEKAFLKKLKSVFYKKYKTTLFKLSKETIITEKWRQIASTKSLIKTEIDELLDLRKLKNSAYNKNTAILEIDLLIKEKKVTLKYKAIAGKGQSAEDLVKSVNQEDLIRQLELTDKNDLMSHFKAVDKQTGELKNRFQDSEVKMLDTFDEHLSIFHVKYGTENIKVINMRLNTLYEPCMSCKKQIIIRQEIHDIKQIDVKAVWNIKEKKFVQGNKGLQELNLLN